MYIGIDPLYIFMILPVFILSIWAQLKVKSSYNKYFKQKAISGYTGAEVAQLILTKNGITDIKVEITNGWLSDHYSPAKKVLKLSNDVYNSNSIAAIGVAAHEAGHALQDFRGVFIMKLWMALSKPVSIMSNAATWLIIIGFIASMIPLALIGFYLFLGVVFFQLLTLPLEFDASNQAKKYLYQYGLIDNDEMMGVNSVLNSAALTYVAAAAASLTQLIYFALRLGLLGDRQR